MPVTQDQFERLLVEISDCFITRDFEQWRSRILLPLSLVTGKKTILIETVPQLRLNFDLYLAACDIMRLDSVQREPLQFEDCRDGTWLATYETRLISQGGLATDPYVATALLHDDGGRAKLSSILNARGHYDWTGQ